MLCSLRDLADVDVRVLHKSQHDALDNLTRSVLQDAALHRRLLQRLIHEWEEFLVIFTEECNWLDQITARHLQISKRNVDSAAAELKECQLLMNDERSVMNQVGIMNDERFAVYQVRVMRNERYVMNQVRIMNYESTEYSMKINKLRSRLGLARANVRNNLIHLVAR